MTKSDLVLGALDRFADRLRTASIRDVESVVADAYRDIKAAGRDHDEAVFVLNWVAAESVKVVPNPERRPWVDAWKVVDSEYTRAAIRAIAACRAIKAPS